MQDTRISIYARRMRSLANGLQLTIVTALILAVPNESTAKSPPKSLSAPATSALRCDDTPIDIATSSPLTGASTIAGQWDSARPGMGFNYMTGQLAGFCTTESSAAPVALPSPTSSPPSPVSTNAGICSPVKGTQQYHIQLVESVESLSQQLEASASASVHGIAWSAQASTTFVQQNSVSSLSRFLLIEASVELSSQTASNFALTAFDRKSLKHDPAAFRRRCGDHFIRSVWYGGLFRAVYHFKNKTQSQADAVTASLRATVNSLGSLNTAADFRSAMSKFSSNTELDVFVIQAGGGFSRIATDPAALLQQLNTFFCNVNSKNTPPVRIELAGYDTINLDGVPIQYTGNHAGAITEMAHLETKLWADKQFYQIQADGVHADCPAASDEFQRVADARGTAIQQLSNVMNECRDLKSSCRRCSSLAASAPKLDPDKAHCDRCASNGGMGMRSGEFCRSCSWSMGDFSLPDSAKGESESDNSIAMVSCNHMKPGAQVEIRAKGSLALQLSEDGAGCQQTCLPGGSKARVILKSAQGQADSRDYCFGAGGGPKRTLFDAFDLSAGMGPWWSQRLPVAGNGTAQVGLMFHGFAYNCDNPRNFSRQELVRGLEFSICESGYCDQ